MSLLTPGDPIHGWITEHGRAWGPRVVRAYDEEHTVKSACFSNALLLMRRDLDLSYCEGYAQYGGVPLPIHHAWCVTQAGGVVDPTWADGDGYFGVWFGREYATRRHDRMRSAGSVGSLINPSTSDRNFRLLRRRVSRATWER